MNANEFGLSNELKLLVANQTVCEVTYPDPLMPELLKWMRKVYPGYKFVLDRGYLTNGDDI